MLLVALADEVEDQRSLSADLKMFVLKCGYAVGLVVAGTVFGTNAEVKRVDEPHHNGQHFLFRKSFESDVAIGRAAEVGKILTELFDLGKFFTLLPFREFGVVQVLDPAGRVHSNRLNASALGRTNSYERPSRRDNQVFNPFQLFGIADLFAFLIHIVKATRYRPFSQPPLRTSTLFDDRLCFLLIED